MLPEVPETRNPHLASTGGLSAAGQAQWLYYGGASVGTNLFDDLPKAQVDKLYTAGHLRTMRKGEAIFYKGEEGSEFFIILTGKVAVIDEYNDAKRLLATLETGDCFGEMAVFSGRTRSATVLCREPGQLLVIDEDRLADLGAKDLFPQFLQRVIVVLAERLRRTNALYLESRYGIPAPADPVRARGVS